MRPAGGELSERLGAAETGQRLHQKGRFVRELCLRTIRGVRAVLRGALADTIRWALRLVARNDMTLSGVTGAPAHT